jgi:kanamycin nucleotidyltransferase
MSQNPVIKSNGPQQFDHETRLKIADEICERILALHGEAALALGLYGSVATNTDGPFSDIEILCVLKAGGKDYSYEWTYNGWKAEVNFVSKSIVFNNASMLDVDWSRTHGAYTRILPLYDPSNIFIQLREVVFTRYEEGINDLLRDVVVGELFELVGKLRNAMVEHNPAGVPLIAMEMTTNGAFLIGLANRYLYHHSMHMFEESLNLPGRPAGYDELCQMVMKGDLSDSARISQDCENFWVGVEAWTKERGIRIYNLDKIPF